MRDRPFARLLEIGIFSSEQKSAPTSPHSSKNDNDKPQLLMPEESFEAEQTSNRSRDLEQIIGS